MTHRQFTLKYPEAPRSLNAGGAGSRRHWAVGYREKRRWERVYHGLLTAERVPTGAEHVRADAVIQWKTRRRRDVTNYIAPIVKPLADTLVAGLWIPDDTDEFFEWGTLGFKHPDWTHVDPRVNAILILYLRFQYSPLFAPEHPVGGGRPPVAPVYDATTAIEVAR